MTCNQKKRCGNCPECLDKILFLKMYSDFPNLVSSLRAKMKAYEAFTNKFGYGEDMGKAISALKEYYWITPPRDTPGDIYSLMSKIDTPAKIVRKKTMPVRASNHCEEKKKIMDKLKGSSIDFDMNSVMPNYHKEAEKQKKELDEHLKKEGYSV